MICCFRLALFSSILFQVSCGYIRTPSCYIFPSGYSGWATIDYEVAGSEPVFKKDGCIWFDFRRGSEVQTASHLGQGWATDRYFEDKDGQLQTILNPFQTMPGRAVQAHLYEFRTENEVTETKEHIFIGTAEQLRASP